jgi:hypothetical protein
MTTKQAHSECMRALHHPATIRTRSGMTHVAVVHDVNATQVQVGYHKVPLHTVMSIEVAS